MAKLVVIVSFITLSFVLAGCQDKELSKPQVLAVDSNAAPNADSLYAEAISLERQAGPSIVKDEGFLRMALDKYGQLITKYPKSDKIDDVAFRMARIYEYLKDYDNAVKNYQRTYQWNPQTSTPARFKTAYILDTQLGRRAEALQIYQEALSKITRTDEHRQWVAFAEQRVKELTGQVKPQQ